MLDFYPSFIRNYNGDNGRVFLDTYPDYPVYATVLYLVMVFYLPGLLKRHKKTFTLKWITACWNLFLSVFSTFGAYYSCELLYNSIYVYRGFYATSCELNELVDGDKLTKFVRTLHRDQGGKETQTYGTHDIPKSGQDVGEMKAKFFMGPTVFFVAMFLYLKTPELLDTLFLILQGKPVSFLHWFHHIVTAIYCWHGGYVLIPSGLFFIAMNYSVHSIMYSYYFLVVLGFRKKIRWFAPVITLLQCSQMFIGMYITCYTYLQHYGGPAREGTVFYQICKLLFSSAAFVKYEFAQLFTNGAFVPASAVPAYKMSEHFHGCDTDRTNLRMAVMMFGAYCVLFVTLFKELYLDKSYNANSIVLARPLKADNAKFSSCSSSGDGGEEDEEAVSGTVVNKKKKKTATTATNSSSSSSSSSSTGADSGESVEPAALVHGAVCQRVAHSTKTNGTAPRRG